jgi:hypothetical protein
MKKILILLCSLSIIFCFAGCEQSSLPTNVSNVGDTIQTKNNDLLEGDDIIVGEGGINSGSQTTQNFNTIQVDFEGAENITVNTVKGWLADYTLSSYTENETDDGYTYNETKLTAGGTIKIISFYDNYAMTEISYNQTDDIEDSIKKYISAYIGRSLAESESEEITEAIKSIQENNYSSKYISSLANSASVNIVLEDNKIIFQII